MSNKIFNPKNENIAEIDASVILLSTFALVIFAACILIY